MTTAMPVFVHFGHAPYQRGYCGKLLPGIVADSAPEDWEPPEGDPSDDDGEDGEDELPPDADDPRWSDDFGDDFEDDEPEPEPGDFWPDDDDLVDLCSSWRQGPPASRRVPRWISRRQRNSSLAEGPSRMDDCRAFTDQD